VRTPRRIPIAKRGVAKADDNLPPLGYDDDMDNSLPSRVGRLEGLMQGVLQRLDALERRMERIEDKIDRQFIYMIGGLAVILGVMAKGFGWLN
jgi:hypothetical protein